VDADGYFGAGPMQDCDAVQCSNPFKNGSLHLRQNCAQLLVFARVFRIYGTWNVDSSIKRR
jgi:hypothetical protein